MRIYFQIRENSLEARFGLTASSRHVEIASNDGYLLQYSKAKGRRFDHRQQRVGACA